MISMKMRFVPSFVSLSILVDCCGIAMGAALIDSEDPLPDPPSPPLAGAVFEALAIDVLQEGVLRRRSLWRSSFKYELVVREEVWELDRSVAGGRRISDCRYPAGHVIVRLDPVEMEHLGSFGYDLIPIGPPAVERDAIVFIPSPSAPDSVWRFIDHLAADPIHPVAALPDHLVSAFQRSFPDDPDLHLQWAVANQGQSGGYHGADLNLDYLWQHVTAAESSPIAIIDSGIDLAHPDLAAAIWRNPGEVPDNGLDDDGNGLVDDLSGWDFYHGDPLADDEEGHGTHVAGIAAARGNNGIGGSGVVWQGAVVPMKFLGPTLDGTTSDAIAAIRTSTALGIPVVNLSWGSSAHNFLLLDSLRDASTAGQMIVAAAGNEGVDLDLNPIYPASFELPGLLAVAASDARGLLSSGSNHGRLGVHLAAPGRSIWSTDLGGGYRYRSGTSMAAPQISGLAALLRSATGARASMIRDALQGSASYLLGGPFTAFGMADASGALSILSPDLGIPPLPARFESSLGHSPSRELDLSGISAFHELPLGLTFDAVAGLAGYHRQAGNYVVHYDYPTASGLSPAEIDWHVVDLPGRWREQVFPSGSSDMDWDLDPDRDGRSNVFEYLVRSHPLQADAAVSAQWLAATSDELLLDLNPLPEDEIEHHPAAHFVFKGVEVYVESSHDGNRWESLPESAEFLFEPEQSRWIADPNLLLQGNSQTMLFRLRMEVGPH